jgi:hypothetical protein
VLIDIPDHCVSPLASLIHDLNRADRATWLAEVDASLNLAARPPHHPRLDDNQPEFSTLADIGDSFAPVIYHDDDCSCRDDC